MQVKQPFNPSLLSSENLTLGRVEFIRFVEEKWCIGVFLPLNERIDPRKSTEYLKPKTGDFEKALNTLIQPLVEFYTLGLDPEGNLFNLNRLGDMKAGLNAEKEELMTIAKVYEIIFKFDFEGAKKSFKAVLKEVIIEGRGRENKNTGKPQILEAKISFKNNGNEELKSLFLHFYESVLGFLVAPEESGFLK
jgi:hypothetical protein